MLKHSLVSFYVVLAIIAGGDEKIFGAFDSSIIRESFLQDHWTTEQGLPQNTITSIVQTRDGYLWLGTFGGLVRFDGVKFTVFNTVNAPELKNQRITTLYEDKSGTLWIGTQAGDITRYRDGHFSSFDINNNEAGRQIARFYADDQNSLWIANGRIRRYFFNENEVIKSELIILPGQNPERVIFDANFCTDASGNLWILNGNSLYRYQNEEFRKFTKADGLPVEFDRSEDIPMVLSDIAVDRNGIVWIAGDRGIARFDGTRFITELAEKLVLETRQFKFTKDSNGSLWIDLTDGIAQLVENRWIRYPLKDFSATGIRSFISDGEGNFWLGTTGKGLRRLKRRLVTAYDESDGLPNNEANAVFEDRDGQIWLGSRGLYKFEDEKLIDIPELRNNTLISIYQTRDGTLLFGTFGGFYSYFAGKFTNHSAEVAPLFGNKLFAVSSFLEDKSGILWFGLQYEGILRRLADGNYERLTKENGLVNNTILFIIQDSRGALWFGTVGGVSRYENGEFTNYTTTEGLSDNNIRAIYEDADGALWFGTYGGGLNRFKDGKFVSITMRNGLFDDVVSRIIVDEKDNFWMLGNRGIFVANRSDLNDVADGKSKQVNCRSYGTADGMPTNEGNGGNNPAGWRTRDGKFWFPTIQGFVAITPTAAETFLPPTIIEEVLIENQPLDARQPLEIKPGQENLEIRYTGLSFSKPELVRFKYRMEGLDANWVDAGTRRIAYFSHLPPGEYTFTVVAANGDGVWNTEGKSIGVRVIPPFYRAWWFISLIVLCVCALAFAAYKARVSQLEQRGKRQEEFSRRLIELQEQERKRIAGELHDSLSQNLVIIKNRAMISLQQRGKTEQAFEQLEEIAEAASQSLSEVREIAHNLRPFQIDRLGITEAIEAIIERAETAELRISTEIENIDNLLSQEKEINLYRIVQESLSNIIKHAGASEASVKITKSESAIEMTIQDNGKGFNSASTQLSRSSTGGFGLIGIAERARTLGTTPVIESGAGKGTKIYLRINVGPTYKIS